MWHHLALRQAMLEAARVKPGSVSAFVEVRPVQVLALCWQVRCACRTAAALYMSHVCGCALLRV